jgi:AcrR family transcriptional regulator
MQRISEPVSSPPRGPRKRLLPGAGTPATGKPTPRMDPDHLRQREAIERFAEALFAQHGYSGTSIHVVAARAGCSVGHLYNLYESKLGLYRAILESKMEDMGRLMVDALARPVGVEERLGLFLEAVLRYFEKHTAFFRIYVVETGTMLCESHHASGGCVDHWKSQSQELLERLIREGQEGGEFRLTISPEAVVVSLQGMLRAHIAEWVGAGEKGSLMDRAEIIREMLMEGLQTGRTAR